MKSVREEASEWLVAFCEHEVNASGREAFDRWLRTSPENIRAFLRASAVWESAGLLADPALDVEALVQKARAESTVVALDRETPEPDVQASSARASRILPRRHFLAAGLAVLILAAGLVTGLRLWNERPVVYFTGPAEQRTVALQDRSSVQLNARSQIEVRYRRTTREVNLIAGQALFSVAKDSSRPFTVSTGNSRVRAVGTQFDVYRKPLETLVTVVEGRVSVGETLLSAGEQASVTPQAVHVAPVNVATVTAWSQGKLVFDATALRDVVNEFNRLGKRRLIIEDPSLLDVHISGVFPATDPSHAVRFLQQRFGVDVQENEDEIRIGRRK